MKYLLVMFLQCITLGHAMEYAVITHVTSSIDSISSTMLKDIYLNKRRFVGSEKVVAVNILGVNSAREQLQRVVLHMDSKQLSDYWVQKHFQGVSPPLTQASFESVKLFIENVQGAIGYVPLSMVDEKVKVIYEF